MPSEEDSWDPHGNPAVGQGWDRGAGQLGGQDRGCSRMALLLCYAVGSAPLQRRASSVEGPRGGQLTSQ